MATMTKATIITWESQQAQIGNPALNDERNTKLAEMLAAGKTEGTPNVISPNVTIREWLDQAAAEEFRVFMLGLDEKYGPGLILSVVIEDAN
jgi:hypothetical protein